MEPVSITKAAANLAGPCQPEDLMRVNEAVLRIARLDGTFQWHHHDEDELFL